MLYLVLRILPQATINAMHHFTNSLMDLHYLLGSLLLAPKYILGFKQNLIFQFEKRVSSYDTFGVTKIDR